jgi:hypothetical protein
VSDLRIHPLVESVARFRLRPWQPLSTVLKGTDGARAWRRRREVVWGLVGRGFWGTVGSAWPASRSQAVYDLRGQVAASVEGRDLLVPFSALFLFYTASSGLRPNVSARQRTTTPEQGVLHESRDIANSSLFALYDAHPVSATGA